MQEPNTPCTLPPEQEREKSYTEQNAITSRDLISEARRQVSKSRMLVARGQELRARLKRTLKNRHITVPGEISSDGKRDSL